MDEIELRTIYNEACKSADKVDDVAVKQCMLYILQMIDGLQEQITEMQSEDE